MLIFTYKLFSNTYQALANTEQLLTTGIKRDAMGNKINVDTRYRESIRTYRP